MAAPVIKVEGLSKRFILSHEGRESYAALRDVVSEKAKKMLAGKRKHAVPTKEEFWALDDVSFSIDQGDRVGIIGRNGAGKSTLLKILSRITEPTKGRIRINGRVASLLEVGTGFHPELTGRENIFLNGAILGMSRSEIRAKFDEIVEFAEVEKFLDTPVKRYSSGMYVRLAFAVAAHLEPEILVVDEVLAVGDAQFQKKCLGKMQDVSKGEGRTILFVSHNMDIIKKLCNKGVMLQSGKMVRSDLIDPVIDEYLKKGSSSVYQRKLAVGDKPTITRVSIDEEELKRGILRVSVNFVSPFKLNKPNVGVVVYNLLGGPVFGTNSKLHKVNNHVDISRGSAVMSVQLPLHTDSYKISVFLGDAQVDYDSIEDVLSFDLISPSETVNIYDTKLIGSLNISPEWKYIEEN
jgi:lipopolysaccharide transport system ATP-binding protein